MHRYFAGEVAAMEGVPVKQISELLYSGALDRERCPLVNGRRMIPEDCLPQLRAALALRMARSAARVRKEGGAR